MRGASAAYHEVVLINAGEFYRFYQVKIVKMTVRLHNRRKIITAIILYNPVTCSVLSVMRGLALFVAALYLAKGFNNRCRNLNKPLDVPTHGRTKGQAHAASPWVARAY